MPGLAPQGPHATIGVSIQPTTRGPGYAWVRYPGSAPCAGWPLGLGGAIIGFDSTVSEDAAQAIEFAAVSQTTPTISMKAAAFFVDALLARARRTPGRSARVLRQDGARRLSPRIGSQ